MDNDQNANIIIPYNISKTLTLCVYCLLGDRIWRLLPFISHMDHNIGSYDIFFSLILIQN